MKSIDSQHLVFRAAQLVQHENNEVPASGDGQGRIQNRFSFLRTRIGNIHLVLKLVCLLGFLPCSLLGIDEIPPLPKDYYAEPVNLPFAETELEKGKEDGWSWTRFRYTSILVEDQPIRIHALYAVPDAASPEARAPAIVFTHGLFGRIRSANMPGDPRYWDAVTKLAKAGYAVLFYEWNPDPQIKDEAPPTDGTEPSYSTFGPIDYSKGWNQPEDDWKKTMPFQAMMAGKRAVSWLAARPEVDATRIGTTGPSYGGIFSSLLAAIDPRIKAASPTVYAAGFGPEEPSYTNLPLGTRAKPNSRTGVFTPEQVPVWRSRFDSEVLLNRRTPPLPLLHIVGTNDSAFDIVKASRHFVALPEPKTLVINPNAGHGDWNFDQTVFFFDEHFQGGATRPTVGDIIHSQDGETWNFSVVSDAPVEFYYTLEMPPEEGARKPVLPTCKWIKISATARDSKQTGEVVLPAEQVGQAVWLHAFAHAKSEEGLKAASPLLSIPLQPEAP